LRETEFMLDLDHANLVRLIGVAVQQRPWLCVLEYMRVCGFVVASNSYKFVGLSNLGRTPVEGALLNLTHLHCH
jgi:hypothetical protein